MALTEETATGDLIGRRPIIDAKRSNVDANLSTGVMSIAAKLLHRILFDTTIMLILEGAKNSKEERRGLREHLNKLASAGSSAAES